MHDRLDRVFGPATAPLFAEQLDLHTVGDLLRHYPRRYAERGEPTPLSGYSRGEYVTVIGVIHTVHTRPMKQRKGKITRVEVWDGDQSLTMSFFNLRWPDRYRQGRRGIFSGEVSRYKGQLQLTHPKCVMIDGNEADAAEFSRPLLPIYPATGKLSSWDIQRCIRQVFDVLDDPPDPLPASLRAQQGLPTLAQALHAVHRSNERAKVDAGRRRLKWDEALSVQLVLARRRQDAAARPAPACPRRDDGLAAAFDARLPFTLTDGQSEVGRTLAEQLAGEHPMNRLLQGEVGSGKTVVALRAMLQVADAGRQAALLAPTEVLAAQHARTLRHMLGDLGRAGELGSIDQATRIALLSGSQPAKARRQALLDAASGAAGIVVGTHALLQEHVSFADLGMVVVDEQHRFGVEQRDALRGRAASGATPHLLVMTATPIPRTVAMTVFGDLEVSSLHELPVQRCTVSTNIVFGDSPKWLNRAWQRIVEEVAAGRQAYVVCPRIGGQAGPDDVDSVAEDEHRRPPLAVLDVAPQLADGPLRETRVDMLHGRLPGDEKEAVMGRFAAGDVDVLVATTVVEVGLDVPNATVMVLMDADRFGISQLHQLRGRVGRGTHPALCLLVTEAPDGSQARERLAAVAATNDGFELARLDLELRREGDVLGATQSGRRSGLKLLSLRRDGDLIAQAREHAQMLLAADPRLANHPGLAAWVEDLIGQDRADYLEKV